MQPCALEVEASVVRNRQQFATLALYENGPNGPDPVPDPINIISIYQCSGDFGISYNATAGAVCTVVPKRLCPCRDSPVPCICRTGCMLLAWSTHGSTTKTAPSSLSLETARPSFGVSDEATLPSLAVAPIAPPAGSAKLHFCNNMGGASDGFGIRFTGGTATSAALVSVFADGDAVQRFARWRPSHHHRQYSPCIRGGTTGNVELKATSRYRLEAAPQ